MTSALEDRLPARFMNNYARRFAAGAFSMPTPKEINRLKAAGDWHEWPGVVAASKTLTRDSVRADFTGTNWTLAKGARVITHIATEPGAVLPDLGAFDFLYAYREDQPLAAQLYNAGWRILFTKVSAASEIIACWSSRGGIGFYDRADLATVAQVNVPQLGDGALTLAMLGELSEIAEWHDDFPYYSDGSWDAVSLRGFDPGDPRIGVKPSEMPRKWKEEHPEALKAKCDWTVLAQRTPTIVQLVKSVPWWREVERVRLLRMQGRGGKGGKLGRHCDITDRDTGTRDGQVARFHVPLVTDPRITMSTWDLSGLKAETHLPELTCWYLDARKPHAVTNRAGIDRVHLVVDVIVDEAVREQIRSGREVTR